MADHRGPTDRSRLRTELRLMLEEADASGDPPTESLSPQQARIAAEAWLTAAWGDKDTANAVEDLVITDRAGAIRARLYRSDENAGTILFFHGGGWVLGSIDTHDGPLRSLAKLVRANILSVEYRKAPEAPYPAALEDAERALRWLREIGPSKGLNGERIILAGDSAGATISAVLSIRARQLNIALDGQVLVYPATDLTGGRDSRDQFASGFFLDGTTMDWYVGHYLSGGATPEDPGVSPLLTEDLSGLPAALLVTADHDPLRDEGRAYAQRLIEAGNDVCYVEWRGVTHGFFNMGATTPEARKLIARIGSWVNQIWQA
jgi:acetyl esterase